MGDSGDSQDSSDDYSSFSDGYSSGDLESLSMGQYWSNSNNPSSNHLPPSATTRPSLSVPIPGRQSLSSASNPRSRNDRNHRSPSSRRATPNPRNPPLPRQPAFDLPDFPLRTANTDNPPIPFTRGIDPPAAIFDIPSEWGDWDGVISPISRTPSRGSEVSYGSWHFPLSRTENGFVDLTDDNADSDMPPTRKKRGASRPTHSQSTTTLSADRSKKRRKTDSGVHKEQQMKNENSDTVEELDLVHVEDDDGLSKTIREQQEAAIKAQRRAEGDKLVKISGLQCIICLESMTDITSTNCGHLFCHSCLMEALIAGEQQESEPGKFNSRCPVCRKKVARPKANLSKSDVIPLEFKLATRNEAGKLTVSISG